MFYDFKYTYDHFALKKNENMEEYEDDGAFFKFEEFLPARKPIIIQILF